MSHAVLESEASMLHATPRESLSIPSGRLGMWWFLASEIVTFGGVVCSYLMLRLVHPEWLHHSSHTLLPIGATNTVVLLTSSLTMVLAHAAAERHDAQASRRWILVTLAFGVLFLGLKGYEYHHEISHGFTPSAGIFWGFYFAMTGLHGLHVIAGLIIMIYLLAVMGGGKAFGKVAAVGLYWHFVDIVWIFLFPLLYVTAQNG